MGCVVNNGSKARLTYWRSLKTAFFTMTKRDFCVCHGKICSRFDFLTMRKVVLKSLMVKSEENVQTVASRQVKKRMKLPALQISTCR